LSRVKVIDRYGRLAAPHVAQCAGEPRKSPISPSKPR
jgi:hypothetical protein